MNCSQCGAEVSATDTFCSSCGNPVAFTRPSADATPTPAGAAPPPPGPHRRRVRHRLRRCRRRCRLPCRRRCHRPPGGYAAYRFQDPATGAPVAEWWQRAVALIIDGAIIWIPGWIIVFVIVTPATRTTTTDAFGHPVPDDQRRGDRLPLHPPGRRLRGVLHDPQRRGEGPDGRQDGHGHRHEGRVRARPDRLRARARAVRHHRAARHRSASSRCSIDYLSPLWDPRRQAWHDKTARSLVITVR